MRGLADLRFGLLHLQHVAHRAVEPGAAVGGAGPCALVEAGQHHHVGADQSRFEQAENAERCGIVPLAAHRKPVQPVAENGCGATEIAVAEEARFLAQQREGVGQHLTALPLPEGLAGNRLAGGSKSIEMFDKGVGRVLGERRQHRRDARRLGDGLLPLRVGDMLHGQRQGAAVLRLDGNTQRMRELADLGRAGAGAQQRELDEARKVTRLARR